MARIIPLSGTENNRKITDAAGKLLSNEIHTTSQGRQYLKLKSGDDVFIGPTVIHEPVADEAAMLALIDSTRGCRPGDWVLREDTLPTPSWWQCISNEGELLSDWRQDTSAASGYHWEPVVEGDDDAELLCEDGDLLMDLVED